MHHFPHDAVGVGFQHMYHLGAWSLLGSGDRSLQLLFYFTIVVSSLYLVLEEHEHVLAMTPIFTCKLYLLVIK